MRSRLISAAVAALTATSIVGSSLVTASAAPHPGAKDLAKRFNPAARSVLVRKITLADGRAAEIFSTGLAVVHSADKQSVTYRLIHVPASDFTFRQSPAEMSTADLQRQLEKSPPLKYVPNRVLVVLKPGVMALGDSMSAKSVTTAGTPVYTNDSTLNTALGSLHVAHVDRLFAGIPRSTLSMMHARAQSVARPGTTTVDFSNAYKLQVAGSVESAVQALMKNPNVAFAEPDWAVTTMNTPARAWSAKALAAAQQRSISMQMRSAGAVHTMGITASTLPTNYAVASSLQPMLNAPSMNVMAAYDEIAKAYPSNPLPGSGTIVTNVSLGDVDDATNGCKAGATNYVTTYGPTTTYVSGQHYIDWPGLPLIPAYVVDANGNANGSASVCGSDPFLDEIGMDFSVMAPLPHNLERAGEVASGPYDLLGIAPGAQYRLVVPGNASAATSDINGAFLAAAAQQPKPDVITASIGIGVDSYGFPSRFLEDDPLSAAVTSAIVNTYGIVVCISAGDGTRLFTTVAIGPSGGSAATNLVDATHPATNENDVVFSTVPSYDVDTGSIDVGGTTVDDIFAANPLDPNNASLASQHAYAETRWTGVASFSSGFGSRVNVSAPSDGIATLAHIYGGAGNAHAVGLYSNGGTSASAPETAAAAAVLISLARQTGHPFSGPAAVRQFLIQTATAVPAVPQADQTLNVGPQVNLGHAVETLLAQANNNAKPAVGRVAIEQRRQTDGLDMQLDPDTDPGNIDMVGPYDSLGDASGLNSVAYLTIAPDWEAMPASVNYSLTVVGHSANVLSTSPWARLLPSQILTAAGMQLASPSTRTLTLEYRATQGSHLVASTTFSLTFGPAAGTVMGGLAPVVPAVVRGTTIPVTYDLRNSRGVSNPTLIVSEPGRTNPESGPIFHPAYTVALSALTGIVNIPVSALQGAGIYGIGIISGTRSDSSPIYTDFAFTRVAPANDTQPVAPLLMYQGFSAHDLEVPYHASIQVQYDVTNVPNASGAMLEISAPGPGLQGVYNPFNNPSGSVQDNNGVDSPSVYFQPLPGTSGTVTLNLANVGVSPSFLHDVRVLPTNGINAVGESSPVSTLDEDPIADPTIGANLPGSLQGGFSINTAATVPAAQPSAIFSQSSALGSVLDTWNQLTNAVSVDMSYQNAVLQPPYIMEPALFWQYGPSFASNHWLAGVQTTEETTPEFYDEFNAFGNIIYGNTTPLAGSVNRIVPATPTTSNGLLASTDWVGGSGVPIIQRYDLDPSSSTDYFVGLNGSGRGMVTWTDTPVKTGGTITHTLSNYIDLYQAGANGSLESGGGQPNFAVDRVNKIAYTGFTLAGYNYAIAIANFNTMTATEWQPSQSQLGGGQMIGMALDSANQVLLISVQGGLSWWNISGVAGGGTPTLIAQAVPDGGLDWGHHPVVDPINHRFFVMSEAPFDANTNNNAMSPILEYDEAGNLRNTFEQFNFLDDDIRLYAQYLNVNGNTLQGSTAATDGLSGITTFTYTP